MLDMLNEMLFLKGYRVKKKSTLTERISNTKQIQKQLRYAKNNTFRTDDRLKMRALIHKFFNTLCSQNCKVLFLQSFNLEYI